MNNLATSIEQSKKLVELRIDVKTADMFWSLEPEVLVASEYLTETNLIPCVKAIPAWSLNALIELMPKQINTNNGNYFLRMRMIDLNYSFYYDGLSSTHHIIGDTPLIAAYNLAICLLENNYIKTE